MILKPKIDYYTLQVYIFNARTAHKTYEENNKQTLVLFHSATASYETNTNKVRNLLSSQISLEFTVTSENNIKLS